MMAKQVFLSLILMLCVLNVGDGYYWHWYTTDRMKTKILFMSRELIKEAIRNFQRIDHIKEYYTISEVYNIGQMLYFIRSKFARMVRLYILAIENNNKFYNFHLHLPTLKDIHHIGMEVYNLVEMLEEYDLSEDFLMQKPVNLKKKQVDKNPMLGKVPQVGGIKMDDIPPNDLPPPPPPSGLRKRPIYIPPLAKPGSYARKPIRAIRNRMKINGGRNVDANFDSDIE